MHSGSNPLKRHRRLTPQPRRQVQLARSLLALAHQIRLCPTQPEVHTVRFSPGTHDWEEKNLRVAPTRPVRTAMVLLEFHQPQGAAWFDDVSLTSGNETERNLLAAPGFEEDDPASVQAQAMSEGYESRVQVLLDSVKAATKSAAPAKAFPALGQQAEALAASITGQGLAAYFPRELRDLEDAREKLALCARLLAERR